MVSLPAYLVIFVCSFLLGSIPFGLILGKVFFHTDIRTAGSGNIGTTNAGRVLGKGCGAAVFLLDFGKGILSGWLSCQIPLLFLATPVALGNADVALCTSLAFAGCILGHIYSPWLGFHGGKGVAVAAGCMAFTFGPVGLAIEIAVFALVTIGTRMVSAGSIAAAVCCIGIAVYLFWTVPLACVLCAASAVVVIFAHRSNISRIIHGEEPRIGEKKNK